MISARMRAVIIGNSGSGKSTLARRLSGTQSLPCLCLDSITWDAGPQRKPLSESLRKLHDFIASHEHWIIEGCYADLAEAALPSCTELHFLNPGTETCIAHCLQRPWEPDKFPTPSAQQAMQEHLVQWVRQYDSRNDEYGLKAHRRLFDQFKGKKQEYTTRIAYPSD